MIDFKNMKVFLEILDFFLQASFETPYVVRLQNVNVLNIPKPLFTFHHPNKGE